MSRRLALWIGLDRVATLVSEIISRSIPSGGRSRSHALRCDRHALIMQMSLGLVRAAVNERCTCIRVPSSGETSGLRVDYDIRARVCVCNQRVCTRYPINFSFASQFSSCSRYEMIERYLVSSRVKLFFFFYGNSIRIHLSLVGRSLAGRHKGKRSASLSPYSFTIPTPRVTQ